MSLRLVLPEMLQPGGPALNAYLLEWCSAHIHGNPAFSFNAIAIGIADDDQLIAVAVYDSFRRGEGGVSLSVECSIAATSPKWMKRGNIRAILGYAFCQLGVQRITALVSDTNERSMKMLKGLGFVTEGYIREARENGAGIYITGMLREESRRWLGDAIDG